MKRRPPSKLSEIGPEHFLVANFTVMGCIAPMSFHEVLAELPSLSMDQRQLLMRCALELDNGALSPEDEVLVEKRLAKHRLNPDSALLREEMNARLRSRFGK